MTNIDNLHIRLMQEGDAPLIATAFADINKTRKQYDATGRKIPRGNGQRLSQC